MYIYTHNIGISIIIIFTSSLYSLRADSFRCHEKDQSKKGLTRGWSMVNGQLGQKLDEP